MEKRLPPILSQTWAQLVLLLGFCWVCYFLNLGRWDLWNPDEPRYAQVAREMVNGGNWILLQFNGKTYGHKPPLFFWLIALSSYLWQGFTSFAVRFPAALFGTLTVLVTFLLGKSLYGPLAGLLSGLVLATSVGFAYLSTRANIDTTLTFFMTASLFSFFKWLRYRGEEESRCKSRKGLWIYGFYATMALATLTKGPVGFILPLLTGLIYLLTQRGWRGIKEMKLLGGMALLLAIVLSWYAPAVWQAGGSYLKETLVTHSINRYASGWAKPHPFYYYFYKFPVDFLPWFLFFIPAVAYGYSKEILKRQREFLFLLIWFVVIFLFFSFSQGKRGLYLLPLFPAASLMVGKLWSDVVSGPMDHLRREWISIPMVGLAGSSLIAGVIVAPVVWTKFNPYFFHSLLAAFLLVSGSLALFVLCHRRHYGAVFMVIVGMMAGGFLYVSGIVFPLVNPYKSARFISQEVRLRISPGEKLGIYGNLGTPPYNFYTGIVPILEWENPEDLFHFLRSPERVFCLLKSKDYEALRILGGWPRVEVVARRNVGSNDVILISNR